MEPSPQVSRLGYEPSRHPSSRRRNPETAECQNALPSQADGGSFGGLSPRSLRR